MPQKLQTLTTAIRGIVKVYNELRTDKQMQRLSSGVRTEVRLRDPDINFATTRARLNLEQKTDAFYCGLEKHRISLPSYLKMVRSFLELAVDRGLLEKQKRGNGSLTQQQKRMYCELMVILGLNFDAHRKMIASKPGSPWGEEPLPLGYADGSAFHDTQEGVAEGGEVTFPGRLRLKDLQQRAREASNKRGGVRAGHIELTTTEELTGDEDHGQVVVVLPAIGGNPHSILERSGGGSYRGVELRRRHSEIDMDDDSDHGTGTCAAGNQNSVVSTHNRRPVGQKRARISRAAECESEDRVDWEGSGSRESYRHEGMGTNVIAVTEEAARSNPNVASAGGGGDGGGYYGGATALGMSYLWGLVLLIFLKNTCAVNDHGEPDDATISEMFERIRWWEGENRFGVPWFEWRKSNGARGKRGSSKRELVLVIWRLFGPAWRTSVMLALVRVATRRSSQASGRNQTQ